MARRNFEAVSTRPGRIFRPAWGNFEAKQARPEEFSGRVGPSRTHMAQISNTGAGPILIRGNWHFRSFQFRFEKISILSRKYYILSRLWKIDSWDSTLPILRLDSKIMNGKSLRSRYILIVPKIWRVASRHIRYILPRALGNGKKDTRGRQKDKLHISTRLSLIDLDVTHIENYYQV